MKVALKILLIVIVAVFICISMGGFWGSSDEIVCTGMELEMEDSLGLGLINEAEVQNILKKQKLDDVQNKKTCDINLGHIEATLSKSPYIDTAYATFNASAKLHLTVIPRIPSLHIMADSGEEYYLDRNGAFMPIGNIIGNLPIVTGFFSKKLASSKMTELARYIQDDPFWRQQVQQIHYSSEHNIVIYTRINDHHIQLGGLDNIAEKFQNLKIFYQKALPKTGWNKYESLDVSYKGVVLGTKRIKEKKED